jgi:hypothetical protein
VEDTPDPPEPEVPKIPSGNELKVMSFAKDMPFCGSKDPAIKQDFSHSIQFGAGMPGINQPETEEIILSNFTKLLSYIIPSKYLINRGPANVLLKQILWKIEYETGEPKQFGHFEKGDQLVKGELFTERQFNTIEELTSLVAAMVVELKIKFPLLVDDTSNRAMLHHTASRHCEKLKISRRHTSKILPYIVEIHFIHTSTQLNALALGHTSETRWRKWYHSLVAPPSRK